MIEELIPAVQKLKGTVSYTDFLLYCCLYKFSGAFLLSENHKDFTTNILDRVSVLTLDNGGAQIRCSGLYTFNQDKYSHIVKKLSGYKEKLNNNGYVL